MPARGTRLTPPVAGRRGALPIPRRGRWLAANGATELDRDAAEGYARQYLGRTSAGHASWTSCLRELARWLRLNGHPDAYVLPEGYGRRSGRPIPYLLSQAEIDAFFDAAAAYDPPSPMAWEARALFGLMHSCGVGDVLGRGSAVCEGVPRCVAEGCAKGVAEPARCVRAGS